MLSSEGSEAMTERDWETSTDPSRMLRWLRHRASDRKLRLFACACVRRVAHLLEDERSRQALAVAERFAESLANEEELRAAGDAADSAANDAMTRAHPTATSDAATNAAFAALNSTLPAALTAAEYAAANCASAVYHAHRVAAAASRQAEHSAQCRLLREIFGNPFRPVSVDSSWLVWHDGLVGRLARDIHDERAFERLPILGDALEDAGCTDAALLRHCHDDHEHVLGCWVLDLLLERR
jgi:hypothetical protein